MGDADGGSTRGGGNERKEAKGFLRGCLAKGESDAARRSRARERASGHRATPSFLISSL